MAFGVAALQDLIRVASKSVVKRPELPNWSSPRTKVDRFIARLQKGLMEGGGGRVEKATEQRMLKSRAKQSLLNSLLYFKLDPKKNSAFSIALVENQRRLYWVKLLLGFGARVPAMQIAREGLAQAEKFDLTANALEFAMNIRRNVALDGESSQFNELNRKVKLLAKIYESEIAAETELAKLNVTLTSTATGKPGTKDEIKKSFMLVDDLLKEVSSRDLISAHFIMSVYAYHASEQYDRIISACDKMEEYRESHPHHFGGAVGHAMSLYKLESYILLKRFKEAKLLAEEFERANTRGRNNWFVQRELAFVLSMQLLDFTRAEAILTDTINHPRFTLQMRPRQEKWEIYQLYLSYAQGKTLNKEQLSVEALRDRVPIFSKDKQGVNVSILIIHILLLLRAGQLDEIVNRMEALQTYRHRYLQGFASQAAIFFKLLQLMERESFNKKNIEIKSQKLLEKLRQLSASHEEMNDGVQILPYEWLWKQALEDLTRIQKWSNHRHSSI